MEFLSGVPLFAAIITLVLGVGLIVLEICLPGFGVPGISGTILTTFSLLVMVNYIGWGTLLVAVGILLLLGCVLLIVSRSAKKGKGRFVLHSSINQQQEQAEERVMPEMHGVALTDLHPSGIASFGEKKTDVVTQGEFISKQARIKVIEADGNRIVVKEIKENV
mgnify:CR=1 FL=1